MRHLDRRTFVVSGLAAAGGVAAVPRLAAGGTRRAAADPFQLGVASGDPRPDGMVLWTRLAPTPQDPDGGMGSRLVPVEWEVATDAAFGNVVARNTETAVPGENHSVHAEPHGLQPGAEYFYRFRADGVISPVGRTRTAPAPGSTPASLTFAMASCQHFERGYYAAHHFIAQNPPDLVLFLGDYMYESPTDRDAVRRYWEVPDPPLDSLTEYRLRYTQTHRAASLRAAHQAAPWVVVFDDHEVKNNWWGGSGATGEVPDTRKSAAFRAFWENMPLSRQRKPTGPAIPLYRRLEWGTLARMHMLDTRQYRHRQAADGDCDWINRTDRTITDDPQERWLLDGLATGGTRWDLVGQQVFFAGRDTDGRPGTCDIGEDAWDGYPHSRRRITQGWVDRQVRNPVVLTGDVHKHWANDLKLNYFDHDARPVGAEIVTSSVTSGPTNVDPPDLSNTPHLNYIGNQRGYVRVRLDAERLTARFMRMSSIREPDLSTVSESVAAKYVVLDGQPGVRPA